MDLQLGGRRVLITGASKGIGLEIARGLAKEGCSLAICARDGATLQAAVDSLGSLASRVYASSLDVTDYAALSGFVDAAAADLGGLDGVVANAGGTVGGALQDSTPEDWTETIELNLGHAAHLIRAAAPHLSRSSIPAAVLISSISGSKPAPRAQYGVSKAALIYLSAALARELAPLHIRVNTVSPGSILFPGGGWDSLRLSDPARLQGFIDRDFPAGRLGTVQEVADVVTFMLSPVSHWINGANIPVDGAQGRPSAGGW